MRNCQILQAVQQMEVEIRAMEVVLEVEVDLPEQHRSLRLIASLKNTKVISKTLKDLVNT